MQSVVRKYGWGYTIKYIFLKFFKRAKEALLNLSGKFLNIYFPKIRDLVWKDH